MGKERPDGFVGELVPAEVELLQTVAVDHVADEGHALVGQKVITQIQQFQLAVEQAIPKLLDAGVGKPHLRQIQHHFHHGVVFVFRIVPFLAHQSLLHRYLAEFVYVLLPLDVFGRGLQRLGFLFWKKFLFQGEFSEIFLNFALYLGGISLFELRVIEEMLEYAVLARHSPLLMGLRLVWHLILGLQIADQQVLGVLLVRGTLLLVQLVEETADSRLPFLCCCLLSRHANRFTIICGAVIMGQGLLDALLELQRSTMPDQGLGVRSGIHKDRKCNVSKDLVIKRLFL